MKKQQLAKLFKEHNTNELEFTGKCHCCKQDVEVLVELSDVDDNYIVSGGAVYQPFEEEKFFLKCDDCFQEDRVLRNYRTVDMYSRVVGYMRPVNAWNKGKQAEFEHRKNFKLASELFFLIVTNHILDIKNMVCTVY